MADITLRGITKNYGGTRALRGLDLEIKDGEFFVLLGQTGAGKTTTLRMIAGLEKPTEGQIFIDGQDVADLNAAERDVALVLQQYSLYPRLTVRGNLEFPLKSKVRAMSADEVSARVEKAAKTLQITGLMDRKVEKLSGGEMQRVSIGRAIVREPRLFLMDEPLSALDAKLREALRVELKRLHNELKATFLFVTHDQVEAMSMGDKIGVLNKGRLVQVGTPSEVYHNPINTFVARAVGTPPMNLIDANVVDDHIHFGGGNFALTTRTSNAEGRELTVGIRPENIRLESGGAAEGKIFDIENHGVVKIVNIQVDDTRIHAMVPAQTRVALDEVVRFNWTADKALLFDRASGINLALG